MTCDDGTHTFWHTNHKFIALVSGNPLPVFKTFVFKNNFGNACTLLELLQNHLVINSRALGRTNGLAISFPEGKHWNLQWVG